MSAPELRLIPGGIASLHAQSWPMNRVKGDFRKEIRERAELEPRVTICGWCGEESPPLDGPCGRAWFAAHQCDGRAA